ncbi:MAG: NAD(P)/FAD-dependent oxidoreductase [Sneathiella sp.]
MAISEPLSFDVVVIGAGAAGLMCAIEAGRRGRSVLVLEKAEKIGKKILISGGGRCNFTNLFAAPDKYVSENRHYCKSALRQYTQQDFISLATRHGVAYHEKKLGQLFCDTSASEITDLLEKECRDVDVQIWCNAGADKIAQTDEGPFSISLSSKNIKADSVVIATGGLSIPKMGATDFAHRIARQFDLPLTEMKPGLVPFTFEPADMERFAGLSGISADVTAKVGKTSFRENVLFTHRGVSGPAILQISSFWKAGDKIALDFLPDTDLLENLKQERTNNPKGRAAKYLTSHLANRLVDKLLEPVGSLSELGNCSDKMLTKIVAAVKQVEIYPNGTEGYKKAEVTIGGVDTAALNSKTMEVKVVPGLYFIGEAVDVTGFLGGYNFQWAWSSGYVAGLHA